MCCGTESHHSAWHWAHHSSFCACSVPFHCGPRFLTNEEKAAWLGRYLESLQEEVRAVEERIAKLKEEE